MSEIFQIAVLLRLMKKSQRKNAVNLLDSYIITKNLKKNQGNLLDSSPDKEKDEEKLGKYFRQLHCYRKETLFRDDSEYGRLKSSYTDLGSK